ncbi:MAG: AAA family ATPase [Candidatus Gastranaerophilales bacterium]|nr:AAA family ATPase [Candidatus Gastranaerophilales bacterium]
MKINAIDNIKNVSFEKNKKEETPPSILENIKSFKPNFNFSIPKYQKRYERMLEGMTASGQAMADLAEDFARRYVIYKDDNSSIAVITKEHYYLAFLHFLLDFAHSVQNGTSDYAKDRTHSAEYTAEQSSEWIWHKDNVGKTAELIEEEFKNIQNELKEKSKPNAFISSLEVQEALMKDINDLAVVDLAKIGTFDIKNLSGNDSYFISAIQASTNPVTHAFSNRIDAFFQKLFMGASTDKTNNQKRPVMPYYQDIAGKVIKNADRNYNMFVTYSATDDSAPDYFIDNLIQQLNNLDDSQFKNLKKDKIKPVVFNEHSKLNVIATECNSYQNDPDTQYFIIIKNFYKVFYDSTTQDKDGNPVISSVKIDNSIGVKAKNIHYILLNNQDDYYDLLEEPIIERAIRDYQNIQIPIMDSNALREQILITKDFIKSQIGTDIDDDALAYITSLPLNSKGSGYDNTIRFIKNIASYYVNSEKITKDMASSYWENTQKSNIATKDAPYEIVFDTNKNLNDIKGTPMVKRQAENVIYELKNYPKTKGYILYNAHNSSGGRMNCAKAIAGELKIPMICINASDFAIRDLDTINQDPMKAIEVKMNKLINTLKTQAQANPNKMVMLFISNFDHFSSDPIYGYSSIYEQQAFQKLLKEMDKSKNDKDYNIVVMGASDYPELTKQDIMRPGLFIDDIVIYPPSTPENLEEIARFHIEKNNYKLDEKTLSHLSKVAQGSNFNYIDMVDLIDRAYILSGKRGAREISISDINEAYLSKESGEVSDNNFSDRQKDLIIRHEGAHALNLEFMHNLIKSQGDNLKLGNEVLNIALDPRGDYLGCVYNARPYENPEASNLETVMSDIVCAFGGNSAEELYFDMQGSWGTTQDRISANMAAKNAVLYMGLGARMGHFIPDIDPETGIPQFGIEDDENYSKDVKVMLDNAKTISDKIAGCYGEFLEEFSKQNISKFGTGQCIITGEEFSNMLSNWENKQPKNKKQEIERLKKEVLSIIEYTKKGITYSTATKFNPLYRFF